MIIDKRIHDSFVILSLDGTLFGGSQSLSLCKAFQELLSNKQTNLILDLSKLSWLSIAGTGILISALTSFRNHGGDIKLACATQEVKEQLDNASFSPIFEQYNRIEAAIAAH